MNLTGAAQLMGLVHLVRCEPSLWDHLNLENKYIVVVVVLIRIYLYISFFFHLLFVSEGR